MLRGILEPMEKHHRVRISDEAVVAAVQLSARYIPARQLPDKAVSLLDTACARVAISQSTTPAAIADLKVAIEGARRRNSTPSERESDIGRAGRGAHRRAQGRDRRDRGEARGARRPSTPRRRRSSPRSWQAARPDRAAKASRTATAQAATDATPASSAPRRRHPQTHGDGSGSGSARQPRRHQPATIGRARSPASSASSTASARTAA